MRFLLFMVGNVATREKIMSAAEQLFIERGYAATSMRAIADRAGVNLAATNYHFGSKHGLLTEVFHRRVEPFNQLRLQNLDALQAGGKSPTARDILEAFCSPFLQRDIPNKASQIVGWIYSEPSSVARPLLEREFSVVASRFQQAFATLYPDVSAQELRWRFHFLVGSLLHLLRLQAPLGDKPSQASLERGMRHLIDYSLAGLAQH
ncbi:MAG: TetR/AcrR family transcriptional regulator [Pseudomonadota bacterium]